MYFTKVQNSNCNVSRASLFVLHNSPLFACCRKKSSVPETRGVGLYQSVALHVPVQLISLLSC